MGMSFATIVTLSCSLGLPLIPITPNQVKRTVTKSGSVSKEMVIKKFVSLYSSQWLSRNKSGHEHIADAGMVLTSYLRNIDEQRASNI